MLTLVQLVFPASLRRGGCTCMPSSPDLQCEARKVTIDEGHIFTQKHFLSSFPARSRNRPVLVVQLGGSLDLPVVTASRSRFFARLIVVGVDIFYVLLDGFSGSWKATFKYPCWRDLKICSDCKATATTMETETFHHTYSHASSNSSSTLPT